MYFKKIVDFAKDAIRTIAPALSSNNKFGASTAGLIKQTGYEQVHLNRLVPEQVQAKRDLNSQFNKIGGRVVRPGSHARNLAPPNQRRVLPRAGVPFVPPHYHRYPRGPPRFPTPHPRHYHHPHHYHNHHLVIYPTCDFPIR